MRTSPRQGVMLTIVASCFAPILVTLPPALSQSAAAIVPMVAVAMSAPHIPSGSHFIGAIDPSTPLGISLALEPSNSAGLDAFAVSVSTPGSPDYRRFLTPSQVQARFGPESVTVQAARAWLQSQGLSVGATSGDGLDIPASGTAAAVEAAFRTKIARFSLDNGRQVFANRTAPEVPSGLCSAVAAVLGLDDLSAPTNTNGATPSTTMSSTTTTASTTTTSPPAPVPPGAASPCTAASSAASQKGSLTADQIADYYGFNSLYADKTLGKGVTIGLMELADFADSDVATFEQCYGISTPVTRVRVAGGPRSTQLAREVVLDIDVVVSTAPEAKVLVYVGPSQGGFKAYYDTFAAIAQQDQAQVISSSWGQRCEASMVDGGVNDALVEEPLFEEMATQGQSFLASAGDQGAQGCTADIGPAGVNSGNSPDPYAPSVNSPANDPFVLGVGGTEIAQPSIADIQTVWNHTGTSGDGSGFVAPFDGQGGRPDGYPGDLAGSGGISTFFQMPPWQVGIDKSGNSSGAPCGVPPTTSSRTVDCREIPDVSALAVDYLVYMSSTGGWQKSGGTSAAAPLWASLVALADQSIPQNRLGLLAPALYSIARNDSKAFTPVTQGENDYLNRSGTPNDYICIGSAGATNQPCYVATSWNNSSGQLGAPQYNMAAGLGTPNARPIVTDLDGYQVGITTTTLPDAVAGSPYSDALQGKGGLTPYAWTITGGTLPPGLSLDPVTGVISGTPARAGTFSFTIQVVGAPFPIDSGDDGSEPPPSASASFTVAVVASSGYWITTSAGEVSAFGSAAYFGSAPDHLSMPVVAIISTSDALGFWLVASDGGVFSFGDAGFYGSAAGTTLHGHMVGGAASPSGHGYWLAASDGGVFSFGDAGFYGSAAGLTLSAPVVGIAPTPDGHGYWLAASDGGVFCFGDANFFGSAAGLTLSAPVVGVGVSPTVGGYWLVTSTGQVLALGRAPFLGSPTLGSGLAAGIAVSASGNGYLVLSSDGYVSAFGDATSFGLPTAPTPGSTDVGIAPSG